MSQEEEEQQSTVIVAISNTPLIDALKDFPSKMIVALKGYIEEDPLSPEGYTDYWVKRMESIFSDEQKFVCYLDRFVIPATVQNGEGKLCLDWAGLDDITEKFATVRKVASYLPMQSLLNAMGGCIPKEQKSAIVSMLQECRDTPEAYFEYKMNKETRAVYEEYVMYFVTLYNYCYKGIKPSSE